MCHDRKSQKVKVRFNRRTMAAVRAGICNDLSFKKEATMRFVVRSVSVEASNPAGFYFAYSHLSLFLSNISRCKPFRKMGSSGGDMVTVLQSGPRYLIQDFRTYSHEAAMV